MELINVKEMVDFSSSKVGKNVPILTDQLMATLLFIPPNTDVPAHLHGESDEIHYVIKGTGKITIGEKTQPISQGMLILVPINETHNFSTSDDTLLILSGSTVCEPGTPHDTGGVKRKKMEA